MKSVSLAFLAFILGFSIISSASHAPRAHIISFKIWKQKKIDESKSVVAELKRELKKTGTTEADDDERQDLKSQLTQAELNLGVARDLSANDYFVLYVAPQFKDSPEALQEAAKNLSSKDVAEILGAYERRLAAPAPAPDSPTVYGAKNVGVDSAL